MRLQAHDAEVMSGEPTFEALRYRRRKKRRRPGYVRRSRAKLDLFPFDASPRRAEATKAGQWDIVALLAKELSARRLERAGVVDLEAVRNRPKPDR